MFVDRIEECDKCGLLCLPEENALNLEMEVRLADKNVESLRLIDAGTRHIRCSPSRAQFIVHPEFPPVVDNREGYGKHSLTEQERRAKEARYTQAWLKITGRN